MFLTGLNQHFKTIGNTKLPKKHFNSLQEAQSFISNIKDLTAKAYKCNICGKYHIGHNKSNHFS